jgi:hypothetical protein
MSSALFETEQYVSRATVSFQHLTGYIEQTGRFIISCVPYGSQDVVKISGGLWNLDKLMWYGQVDVISTALIKPRQV